MKLLSLLPLTVVWAADPEGEGDAFRPVENVVNLLREMSKTLAKEQADDDKLNEKMKCWCRVNKQAKTKAIREQTAEIKRLENKVAQHEGGIRKYTAFIEDHEKKIKELNESLDTATEIRANENKVFLEEKADLEQTLTSLVGALKILKGHHGEKTELLATAFTQLAKQDKFQEEMNKDLWEMLGKMQITNGAFVKLGAGFLQQKEEPVRDYTNAEITDDSGVEGSIGGNSSYNNRSGKILGILKQMHDNFANDLSTAIKTEANSLKTFQELKVDMEKQLFELDKNLNKNEHAPSLRTRLGTQQRLKGESEAQLAVTEEALAVDVEFLANLVEKCDAAAKAYQGRTSERTDEKLAVDQCVSQLNSPEVRAHFQKTTLFLQMASSKKALKSQNILKRVLVAARAHHNKPLAMLAMTTSPESMSTMDKIKKAISDMIASLKVESTGDVQKRQTCLKDLDDNKSNTFDENTDLKHADHRIELLDSKIDKVTENIKDTVAAIHETNKQIQIAGFDRAEENKEFQTSVHDQKLTIEMLKKAMGVLEEFYKNRPESEKKAFIGEEPAAENRPGAAVGERPPTAAEANVAYKPSAGAEGVMLLLEGIIGNANKMIADLGAEEQEAQKTYEKFVSDSNAVVAAAEGNIAEKQTERAGLNAAKSDEKTNAATATTNLGTLGDEKKGLDVTCNFLLDNYDSRMSSREEEIEGLQQGLAILSGAEFENLTLV